MELSEFKELMSVARERIAKGKIPFDSTCNAIEWVISRRAYHNYYRFFAPYIIAESEDESERICGIEHRHGFWLGQRSEENLGLRLCFLDCFETWATHEISGFAYKGF